MTCSDFETSISFLNCGYSVSVTFFQLNFFGLAQDLSITSDWRGAGRRRRCKMEGVDVVMAERSYLLVIDNYHRRFKNGLN